ncbi:MAG: SpoIIE family protein phosphatase [Flavobacteriales bacterium]|nr:SpoIIE family protein phosphatase [Flavobacteriales bacterium]
MNRTLIDLNRTNWKSQLETVSIKYHKIGAWCGFAFNLIFSISDYFIMPEYWLQFFIIRSIVSAIILASIFGQRAALVKHEIMIATAVLLISVENAYLYSVMDVEMFQQHTFAYIALFIGCGMLVLWERIYSIVIVVANIVSGIILFPIFSPLTIDQVMANGGMLTISVSIFTIFLINTRYNLTVKEIKARLALSESNEHLNIQKELVEERNKEIRDSITYAKRIQDAMLPSAAILTENLHDSFVLYKPKDIVAGDFYWLEKIGDVVLFAAADCTGHGVPGAMVSVVCIEALNRSVREFGLRDPGEILTKTRELVVATFEQSEEKVMDGMDIALISLNRIRQQVKYAGAYNPLFQIKLLDDEVLEKSAKNETHYLHEVKADKQPVSKYMDTKPFTTHTIKIASGDMLIIASDGYQDQFGGPKGKKFRVKIMKELLLEISDKDLSEQNQLLDKAFEDWRGDEEQVDDICVIGVRI